MTASPPTTLAGGARPLAPGRRGPLAPWALLVPLVAIHLAAWALAASGAADVMLNHQDSVQYLAQAMNMRLHHVWYAGTWNAPYDAMFLSTRPPLYAWLIGVVMAAWHSPLAVTMLQCAVSVASLVGIARALGDYPVIGRRGAWIAAALIVCPSQLVYANTIMAETLVQACIVWAFLAFRAHVRSGCIAALALAGGWLALGAWVKPVLVLAWVPLLAVVAVRVARRETRAIALAPALLPLAAVIALALAQGARTGSVHYSSLPAYNLLTYNLPQLLGRRLPEPEVDRRLGAIDREARAQHTLGARLATIERAGAHEALADPAGWAALQLRGMVVFLLDPGRFDVAQFLRIQPPGASGLYDRESREGYGGVWRYLAAMPKGLLAYLLVVAAVNLLIACCFVAALADRRIEAPVRGLLAAMVGYVWIVTGMLGAARFRMPVEPLLLFALPFGLERLRALAWRRAE